MDRNVITVFIWAFINNLCYRDPSRFKKIIKYNKKKSKTATMIQVYDS